MGLCENDSFVKYSQEKLGREWERRIGEKKPGQVQFQEECQAQHDQEALEWKLHFRVCLARGCHWL